MKRIKNYNTENCVPHAEDALLFLRDALRECKLAGASRTAARVRSAISSAKGAVRAAGYRQQRAARKAGA